MPGALDFAGLMERFAPFAEKVALAVSGGPDSMALAYSAKRWGQRPLVALIVEHGLRPESAAEAGQVKKNLKEMGIEAEILPWSHGEVEGRVQEKARAARYGLLIEACRRLGAGDLLFAHHRDDQAETVLMRLAKGSGIDGLAGMPEESERGGIRFLRPFLGLSKEELVRTCQEAGVPYVIDPTNGTDKYARGRLRKIMPLLASEGLTAENLARLSARAREAKEALDMATREFMGRAAQEGDGGILRLNRELLCAAPRAIALRAVAAALRHVHDEGYPPEYASLSGLLDAICGEKDGVRTLFGCLVSRAGKKVTFMREPSAATEVVTLLPGQTVLWDKRWKVSASPSAPQAEVRALGFAEHEEIDSLMPGLRRRIPEGRIRATLPAVWAGEKRLAVASFEEKEPFWAVFVKRAIS